MNILDIEIPDNFVFPSDLLGAIFSKQKELAAKYCPIEGNPIWPIDPSFWDNKTTQAHLKDFAWRTIEELAEMVYAERHSLVEEHGQEELGDALHFLTELCLIVDYDYHRLDKSESDGCYAMESIFSDAPELDPIQAFANFVVELGWAMNHLKAKVWKQTIMLTDWSAFTIQLDQVWLAFAELAFSRGIGPRELYLLYHRKSLVNDWRIETKY